MPAACWGALASSVRCCRASTLCSCFVGGFSLEAMQSALPQPLPPARLTTPPHGCTLHSNRRFSVGPSCQAFVDATVALRLMEEDREVSPRHHFPALLLRARAREAAGERQRQG